MPETIESDNSPSTRYWSTLERHPLSADYGDLTGAEWEQLVNDLKQFGILNGRKITLHEGKVLDGWQLLRACVAAEIKPEFVELPAEISAGDFVRVVNDNRRHESEERKEARIAARRTKVASLREQGKSTRQIAAELGVSSTLIGRDLRRIARDTGKLPMPLEGTVIGRDGSRRKHVRRPRWGETKYSWAAFKTLWHALDKEIDKLGELFGAKETPDAGGLHRRLKEFLTDYQKWYQRLKKQ